MAWIRCPYKWTGTLLLMLLLSLLPQVCEAKIYLVSVGVSDYPGSRNDLRLPHNDAATMEWLYKENKQARTWLLRNANATLASVKNALREMASVAKADDIVVLFFSGHGVRGGFVCYDDFLFYQDVYTILATCKSRSKMIFADACYAGTMRQGRQGEQADADVRDANVMLFLSCRSNERSLERRGMTNGVFTYALQHGLRGGADVNGDRIITALELFDYVSEKVQKETNNRQHPVMWGKFPDNMPVMRW